MSNPLGQDTVNISVNVPTSLYQQVQGLAGSNGMKMGPYVRLVLNDACHRKLQFQINISASTIAAALNETSSFSPTAKVASGAPTTYGALVDAKPRETKISYRKKGTR